MQDISNRFVNGEGFSNGCELLALKNPPPLVPNSLMISCDATGPWAIVCVVTVSITGLPLASTTGLPSVPTRCTCCDSTSFAVSYGLRFCTTPCETRTSAPMTHHGRSTHRIDRVMSTQKLPIEFLDRPGHVNPEITDRIFLAARDAANE